jgi:hypothetical protein
MSFIAKKTTINSLYVHAHVTSGQFENPAWGTEFNGKRRAQIIPNGHYVLEISKMG